MTPTHRTTVCLTIAATTFLLGSPAAQAPRGAYPFPAASWTAATPESQGLDGNTLRTGLDALPSAGSSSPLLVIANGRIVHSRGPIDQPRELFSCSKLITAMIAARLVQEGRIADFDELVPSRFVGAWNAYPGNSSYRDFFSMQSDYGLMPYHPAIPQCAYNNNGIDFVGRHLAQAFYTTSPARMDAVVQTALLSIVGSEDALSYRGQWGGWGGGMSMSCRDVARLGLLLVRGGEWAQQQVLDQAFTNALLEPQIDPRATVYSSGNPNQNDRYNQQHVTDRLKGNWSFGLWRVAGTRFGVDWAAAAAEGFRGKRVMLFPRGTLANPDLEVVLVSLPNLSNEGPASLRYAEAVRTAVIPSHPDHDRHSRTATFDDDTIGPLSVKKGTGQIQAGKLQITAPSRMVLSGIRYTDPDILLSLYPAPAVGSTVGVVARAERESHVSTTLGGTQSRFAIYRTSANQAEVRAFYESAGRLVYFRGAAINGVDFSRPVQFRVTLVGSVATCTINGRLAMTHTGVPAPASGGAMSIDSVGSVSIDYLLAREANGPNGQVTIDSNGDHTLAMFLHRGQQLQRDYFVVQYQTSLIGLEPFLLVQPLIWPNVLGFGNDHFMVSNESSPFRPQTGTQLVVQYGRTREGENIR